MTMTRDEQLELVARNIGEWYYQENPLVVAALAGYEAVYTLGNCENTFTRSEVEAKRREITGEPDDKDAPEWSRSKAQNSNGEWHWYRESNPIKDSEKWLWSDIFKFAGEGEVLGDWRDTLKPVNRESEVTPEEDEALEAMARDGESIGAEEFVNGRLYQDRVGKVYAFVGIDPYSVDKGCFAVEDMNEPYVCKKLSNMKPAPSERDKFVESFSKLLSSSYKDNSPAPPYRLNQSDEEFYGGAIYDAIAEGRLPVPEVKK